MQGNSVPHQVLSAASYLEAAFVRWILAPATFASIIQHITPQQPVSIDNRTYRIDYAIQGATSKIAIELDGFEYHSNRHAFTYDRLRQNDLQSVGWTILRFSYDSIRSETSRCVAQLQAVLAHDSLLATMLVKSPVIETPNMVPDPLHGTGPIAVWKQSSATNYFDLVRPRLNLKTLRTCQADAFAALANYFRSGGTQAACVMSVGAGKTGLGVAASLAFTHTRALIITPGSVIRGTFGRALDAETLGNVLYGLPHGALIPGCKPPKVLTLNPDTTTIRSTSRGQLLAADIILTNFHALTSERDPNSLLSRLEPDDIDLIIVDEAHMAAADSYQRAFKHFRRARTILLSACFQRLDGRPINADVVYRYRLIDAIADGHAKNLRVERFTPNVTSTTYEMVWPDGSREEITGRDELLSIIHDERKLSVITAKSDASIRHVMHAVKISLDRQAAILHPVKPRVLFSALGAQHAEQIARIADEYGIPCGHLHHAMPEAQINSTRARFEQDSGDLQGIVHLKMLGQGYDFPPITVVVPMRPYGSFNEFYQFVGRGIRVIKHPGIEDGKSTQILDIIYHGELGLDEHIDAIYRENEMDPRHGLIEDVDPDVIDSKPLDGHASNIVPRPATLVLFEHGDIESRIVHDKQRVEQRRMEREAEAFAQRYALYAQSTNNPVPIEKYMQIMRALSE